MILRVICVHVYFCFFFFSSRRRHTRCGRDWSSDVCSSDLNRNPFIDHPEFVEMIWGTYVGVEDYAKDEPKELIMVLDVLGREVEIERGVLQFYIYSDGSVEKRVLR